MTIRSALRRRVGAAVAALATALLLAGCDERGVAPCSCATPPPSAPGATAGVPS